MRITGINYLALGLKGNKQIGGDDASSEKINLNDGLSQKELELIDKNKDGTVTIEEFQQKYGSDDKVAQDKFNDYLAIINFNSEKNTQKYNNKTVKSTYDNSGKLTSYTESTVNSETGATTTIEYSVVNGKAVKGDTKTKYLDGTSETVSADGKTVKRSSNGVSVTTTNGKLTSVSNTDSKGNKEQIKFTYDSKGNIKSVKIKNGDKSTTCDNVSTSKDGNILTVKDSHGKTIAKIKTEDGKTSVIGYSEGKKQSKFTFDTNNNPTGVKKYNSDGKVVKTKNAETGITKKKTYDENGNLTSTVKYNAEGKKVSSYTYSKKDASVYYGNKTGALVKSKTNYDENGNVTGYEKYTYKTNDDKTSVTKKVKTYPDLSKAVITLDSYGNTLFKHTTTADGQQVSKEYTYDTELKEKVKVPLHYKEVVTNNGNKNIVDTYKDGGICHKEVTTFKNGEGNTTQYDYEYYPKSNNTVKSMKMTDSNGKVTEFNYNVNGSYTKTYTDNDNNSVIAKCDKNGNVTHKEVTNSDGLTSKYDYEYDGNKLIGMTETDPYNNVTTYEYKEDGSTSKAYYDENGNSIVEEYNAGWVLYHREVTDTEGSTVKYDYEYDENGNLVTYEYYENGTSKKTYTDEYQNTIVEDYNENGINTHTEVTNQENLTTKYDYEYDDNNILIKTTQTDPYGNVTVTEYYENGTSTKTYKDENGNTVVEYYNENEQKTNKTVTDSDGFSTYTNYEYDDYGNLIRTTENDHEGTSTVTEYYENGSKNISITREDGSSIVENYNEKGKITNKTEKDSEGSTTYSVYEYDENDKLIRITKTDPNGNVTETEYNEDGTYKKYYKDAEENTIVEDYNENDLITHKEVTSPEGAITNYSYEYEYDENDNLITYERYDNDTYSKTYTNGDGNKVVEKYNEKDLITEKQITDNDDNVTTYTYDYEYDDDGNPIVTYERYGNGSYIKKYSDENGNKIADTYDTENLMTHKEITKEDGTVQKFDYEYDENKNIIATYERFDDGSYSKKYKDGGGAIVIDYCDADGNLKRQEELDENNNVIATFEFNDDGSFTKKYKDENGNEVIEHYNKDGQLIEE